MRVMNNIGLNGSSSSLSQWKRKASWPNRTFELNRNKLKKAGIQFTQISPTIKIVKDLEKLGEILGIVSGDFIFALREINE